MAVQVLILVISVLNLILLLVNLYLLRHGYAQVRQQLVLVQSDGEMVMGGVVATHVVMTIGKHGNVHHFDGVAEAVTPLRFRELEKFENWLADVYIVPRAS